MIKTVLGIAVIAGDVICAAAARTAWHGLAKETAHQKIGTVAFFAAVVALNVIIAAVAMSRARAKAAAAAGQQRPSYSFSLPPARRR